jgi:hypothetical protein
MSVESAIEVPQSSRHLNDRSFFLFMAVLMLATAVVGFGPNSVAIIAGTREMPPLLTHIHAALMVSWLSLLVIQTSLNAGGKVHVHRRLGQIAIALIPGLLVVMVLISFIGFVGDGEFPPGRYNVLLLQIRAIVLFPLFALWAFAARRYDFGFHKRLMIIATIVPLDAAIARTEWLPGMGAFFSDFELMSAYQLLLIMLIVVYDFWRNGRVHGATLVGVSVFGASTIGVNLLWGSEWWFAVGAGIARLI